MNNERMTLPPGDYLQIITVYETHFKLFLLLFG